MVAGLARAGAGLQAIEFGGFDGRNFRPNPAEFFVASPGCQVLEPLEFDDPLLEGRGE